jgi:glycosyl transferase family 25
MGAPVLEKLHSMKKTLIDAYFAFYNLTARRVPATSELPREPFAALGTFFDAVWVLTIPRSVQRQEFISRQFEGLPFEFFQGVEGRTLTREDPRLDILTCEKTHDRPIKVNELACTFSHLNMYQRILDEGLDRVLIFEDDAVFDWRKARWVSYILARLPADWELLYLGYRDGELRGPWAEVAEALGRPKANTVVSRTVHRGLRTAAGHDFTHAYAVTRKGAQKLLEGAFPIRQTADGLLEEAVLGRRLRAYATVPKIFVQLEDLGSSIHETGPR